MITPNIILPIAATLILSVVGYSVGYFILCFGVPNANTEHGSHEFKSFFRRVSIGVLAIIASYSIYRTAGQTILLGVLIPFFIAFCCRIKQFKQEMARCFRMQRYMPSIRVLLSFAAAVVLLVASGYFQLTSLTGDVVDINQDYSYYASVAYNLSEFGIEAQHVDFANPEMVAPSLYHYTELWLTALVAKCSGVSLYYTLLLVTFPFFGALALLGIGALAQRVVSDARWLPLLAMVVAAMLSTICLKLLIYKEFNLQITPLAYSSLMIQRFYPIIIAFIFALTEKGWRKIAALCVAGFIYPTTIAPILAGLTLYFVYEFSLAKRRDLAFWISVAMVLSCALFFFAFYVLTAVPNPYMRESYSMFKALKMAIDQFGWSSLVQYVTLPLADIVANIAPYALLLFMIKREKRREMLRLGRENSCLLFVLFASVFGFASIWYIRDSVQIYYSVAYPLFLIANSLIVVLALSKGSLPIRGVAVVVFALNLAIAPSKRQKSSRVLDQKLYAEIASALNGDKSEHRFAWIEFRELNRVSDIMLRDAAYRKPLHPISRFADDYSPVRLDVYDIEYTPGDVGEKQVITSIENNSFYRFVIKNKLQKDLNEALNKYIRENKVRYVIVPRGLDWFKGRGFIIQSVIESQSESYSLYILDL